MMATVDRVRTFWNAQPFQPFTLRLVDGTEYFIRGREWLSVPPAPKTREILFYAPVPDDVERNQERWIDVALIAEVVITPSSAQKGPDTNGPQ
jgi:hypothetical protein